MINDDVFGVAIRVNIVKTSMRRDMWRLLDFGSRTVRRQNNNDMSIVYIDHSLEAITESSMRESFDFSPPPPLRLHGVRGKFFQYIRGWI